MAKKKRKQQRIKVEIGGKIVTKAINYYTPDEFEAKKKKIIEAAKQAEKRTFKIVAEQWKSEHDEQVQTYTADCYRAPVRDCVEEFGEYEPDDITPMMIQRFLDEMFKMKYAKQTITLRKVVLCQIFDYAIFHGWMNINPAKLCKVPKAAKKTERELPSEEDVAAIRKNPDGIWGLYCNLLLYTGLRREEALALTYADIDFENSEINVNKTLIFEGNNGVIRYGTKSKAGTRSVPLLEPLKEILDRNKKGPIFYEEGKPIKKHVYTKGFNAYKNQIGITATAHQMRHYFCTLCFEANLDEKDLAGIMGHSKVSLSKDIYTHIRSQRKQESATKLNALFSTEKPA